MLEFERAHVRLLGNVLRCRAASAIAFVKNHRTAVAITAATRWR